MQGALTDMAECCHVRDGAAWSLVACGAEPSLASTVLIAVPHMWAQVLPLFDLVAAELAAEHGRPAGLFRADDGGSLPLITVRERAGGPGAGGREGRQGLVKTRGRPEEGRQNQWQTRGRQAEPEADQRKAGRTSGRPEEGRQREGAIAPMPR